jgi:hypothetical protein
MTRRRGRGVAGTSYYKQHGHMVAFGVRKGRWPVAPRRTEIVANGGCSAARLMQTGLTRPTRAALFDGTRNVEWAQFRLDRDDDIEILSRRLRCGRKTSRFCRANGAGTVN